MSQPTADHAKRVERLLKELHRQRINSLLVTCPFNVTYLTGFTGEDSLLFVSHDRIFLLSDPRYEEQIQSECPDLELIIRASNIPIIDAAAKELVAMRLTDVCVESISITLAQWERLNELLTNASLRSSRGIVERLRERKDPSELAAIERALQFAERAFTATKAMLHEDQTEKNISDELEIAIRRLGGVGSAFKTIVGVGPRSALPHGRPSSLKLGTSGFVLIDWGAKEDLYLSDLTRVIVTGRVSPKLEKIYRTVLEAQQAAIEAIGPGVLMSHVDSVARGVIERAGYGKRFSHGLGHSFGLQIHETIRLARGQDRALEPDMVITVEPGIYLPGFGGVRIEDDVLVTKTGNRVLSSLPKDWESCKTAL